MNCPKILEMLCAYRDRELAGSDRHCVEQHLSGCPQCRGALEELERVGALLSGLPSAEPTPELFGRIVSQLFSDNRPPSPSPVLPSPPEPDPAAAAIASVPGPVILSLHKSDPEAEHRAMEQHLARSNAPTFCWSARRSRTSSSPSTRNWRGKWLNCAGCCTKELHSRRQGSRRGDPAAGQAGRSGGRHSERSDFLQVYLEPRHH